LLSFSVGAYHDGQLDINNKTINPCKVDDQYIMAPYPEQLNSANFYNPFGFSNCSIQYFRTYLTSGKAYVYHTLVAFFSHNNYILFKIKAGIVQFTNVMYCI